MNFDRVKYCAIAAAVAASLTGEAFGQAVGPATGSSTPPSSSRSLGQRAQPATDASAPGVASDSRLAGGAPSMSGVTPNRAELPGSAFSKLDSANRGYVLLGDVRQLEGFESAFRQADQNGDGRLNASEFNSAWGLYTGNVR